MSRDQSQADALLKRAYTLEDDTETKSLYRDWASSYDKTMLHNLGYLTPRKTASLLSGILARKDALILDVGSGTGLAGEYLAKDGYTNLHALDYSSEMLAVAAERKTGGSKIYSKLIEADLNEALPLGDATYDAMICTGTFTHAHVGADCLAELFRILKPGGVFACTVHKDIWQPQGFDEEVRRLASCGVMRTAGMTMDIYFETDEEPQGWYIIWEKAS